MRARPIRRGVGLGALGLTGWLLLLPTPALASRFGPVPGVNGSLASGGTNCTFCHFGGLGFGGQTQILDLPTSYLPGAVYDLRLRIADAEQRGAGFQLSVEDDSGAHVGSLIATDALNTQLTGLDWMSHTLAGVESSILDWVPLGFAAEYAARWQAPGSDVGSITFWAAGNAINDDASSVGDHVYLTSQTLSSGVSRDSDGDGILDDGSRSGLSGDEPCTGGTTRKCDDNCPFVPNADQADTGGVESPGNPMGADPDGVGDVCQCGDADGNSRVQVADADQIRDRLAAVPASLLPERCDVHAGALLGVCDVLDWVILERSFAGLAPGIAQVCVAAFPP